MCFAFGSTPFEDEDTKEMYLIYWGRPEWKGHSACTTIRQVLSAASSECSVATACATVAFGNMSCRFCGPTFISQQRHPRLVCVLSVIELDKDVSLHSAKAIYESILNRYCFTPTKPEKAFWFTREYWKCFVGPQTSFNHHLHNTFSLATGNWDWLGGSRTCPILLHVPLVC